MKCEIKDLKEQLEVKEKEKEKEKAESGKKWHQQHWKQCYVCLQMSHAGICEVCL